MKYLIRDLLYSDPLLLPARSICFPSHILDRDIRHNGTLWGNMQRADHPYAHGSHIAMNNEKQNTLFQKDNFIPYTGSIAVQKQDKADFGLKYETPAFHNG